MLFTLLVTCTGGLAAALRKTSLLLAIIVTQPVQGPDAAQVAPSVLGHTVIRAFLRTASLLANCRDVTNSLVCAAKRLLLITAVNEGHANASRMARTETVTISSINVKPLALGIGDRVGARPDTVLPPSMSASPN